MKLRGPRGGPASMPSASAALALALAGFFSLGGGQCRLPSAPVARAVPLPADALTLAPRRHRRPRRPHGHRGTASAPVAQDGPSVAPSAGFALPGARREWYLCGP